MTAPRFLIDENLSPVLVEPARERGFEAMHINHLGLRAQTDWDLLKVIGEGDWVLVTNNAIEFRGRYLEIELHPGVVFLLPAMRRWSRFGCSRQRARTSLSPDHRQACPARSRPGRAG